jgi:hypothetical protein
LFGFVSLIGRNHIPIFGDAGLDVRTYRYYDRENSCLDYQGLLDDIAAAEDGSIFLLHAWLEKLDHAPRPLQLAPHLKTHMFFSHFQFQFFHLFIQPAVTTRLLSLSLTSLVCMVV